MSVDQLRVSDLHGDSDSVRYEVPGDVERGASRPGSEELSCRTQVHHQNIRLRRLSQHLQLRLLPRREQGAAADTLDGLGIRLACEFNPLESRSNYIASSNDEVGTLAVDGRAVTFGRARRGLGGAAARPVPFSLYQM